MLSLPAAPARPAEIVIRSPLRVAVIEIAPVVVDVGVDNERASLDVEVVEAERTCERLRALALTDDEGGAASDRELEEVVERGDVQVAGRDLAGVGDRCLRRVVNEVDRDRACDPDAGRRRLDLRHRAP